MSKQLTEIEAAILVRMSPTLLRWFTEFSHGVKTVDRDLAESADLAPYRAVKCPICSGKGYRHGGHYCPPCRGTGKVDEELLDNLDVSQYDQVTCPACSGKERVETTSASSAAAPAKLIVVPQKIVTVQAPKASHTIARAPHEQPAGVFGQSRPRLGSEFSISASYWYQADRNMKSRSPVPGAIRWFQCAAILGSIDSMI